MIEIRLCCGPSESVSELAKTPLLSPTYPICDRHWKAHLFLVCFRNIFFHLHVYYVKGSTHRNVRPRVKVPRLKNTVSVPHRRNKHRGWRLTWDVLIHSWTQQRYLNSRLTMRQFTQALLFQASMLRVALSLRGWIHELSRETLAAHWNTRKTSWRFLEFPNRFPEFHHCIWILRVSKLRITTKAGASERGKLGWSCF